MAEFGGGLAMEVKGKKVSKLTPVSGLGIWTDIVTAYGGGVS